MNLSGAGGGAGAVNSFTSPLPPPTLGAGIGDLSKLPVELLAALSAAASQPGGLDPSMFAALAQLSGMSGNGDEDSSVASHSPRLQSNNNKSSSSKTINSSSSKSSSFQGNHHSINKSSSSTSSSSNKPNSPILLLYLLGENA